MELITVTQQKVIEVEIPSGCRLSQEELERFQELANTGGCDKGALYIGELKQVGNYWAAYCIEYIIKVFGQKED